MKRNRSNVQTYKVNVLLGKLLKAKGNAKSNMAFTTAMAYNSTKEIPVPCAVLGAIMQT